jgi:hypothetical protein
MRKLLILLCAPLLLLTACGGGGGGGGTTTTPPPPAGQVIATVGPPNVEGITIDAGPTNLSPPALNTAFVTVTVCVPTTQTCQTIDHIEVDTGSSGLRILQPALTLNLPPEVTAGGMAIAECLPFADGSSFGSVVTADLQMPDSGKTASGINVQIIGATGYTTLPSDCQVGPENTVDAFGANGILGVGPFLQDCGAACAQQVIPSTYYTCGTPTTCANAMVTTAQQVSNPVASFSSDNNGVIVELPPVATAGANTVSGSLVFGIGTETNNALGTATVLPSDVQGFVRASFNGATGLYAALDSGSTIIYVNDNSLQQCTGNLAGLYCPASTVNLTSTLSGASDSPTLAADFSVMSGTVLNTTSANAIPDLAGPLTPVNNPPPGAEPIQFDLGMPFYFGRNVFTAIESSTYPGGYFAY